jgi:imidazoleglycerol-phosphate dehydratase
MCITEGQDLINLERTGRIFPPSSSPSYFLFHPRQQKHEAPLAMASFTTVNVECIDVSKCTHPISTGIGFLDHMIDQLNSHAQIGVAVTVTKADGSACTNNGANKADAINRFADQDQKELVALVGTSLGSELKKILHKEKHDAASTGNSSRFCCPLDEALVECILTKRPTASEGKLTKFTLSPYGKYPINVGRSKIGQLETNVIQTFFASLAQSSGLDISLTKLRGDNGHHVVESAFKAFSRALRNLIDGTDTNEYTSNAFEKMWGRGSESFSAGLELRREGKVERCTKETSILVHVVMDGGLQENNKGVKVDTGIVTMDEFVTIMAKEACISMQVECKGDLYVDDHHTSEDVAIAIGQVMNSALGTKAGLNRMWCAVGTYGGELVR